VIFNLFLASLLVARAGFALLYWEAFVESPWKTLDIRDGGFLPLPGVISGVLATLLVLWWKPKLRSTLAVGVATGLGVWMFALLSIHILHKGQQLPDIALRDISGKPVALHELAGKPIVVNLWATWCPPCRREMPVLQAAQKKYPHVTFVFANQLENTHSVRRFIEESHLTLENVLIDSAGQVASVVGSQALPTTLFYDANGNLVNSHLGELSEASLLSQITRFDTNTIKQ
jgi:thiol-disulfide isomerase/thioredoxin